VWLHTFKLITQYCSTASSEFHLIGPILPKGDFDNQEVTETKEDEAVSSTFLLPKKFPLYVGSLKDVDK
jgi:hypothetical protein